MTASNLKIGFAGSGNMAAAIARGLARGGVTTAPMIFTDAGSGRAAQLAADLDGETRGSLAELAADSDVIVLAVKPAGLDAAAAEMGADATNVVSVLGATPLESLRAAFPDAGLIRTMPNVAVELGQGVVAYAPPDGMVDELAGELVGMFEVLGLALEMPEALLDPATAIMGCSPAYFALVAETLIDAGVNEGIDPQTSQELVAAAIAGTAALLADRDPLSLRRSVASPGGSTEAGLNALEKASAQGAFADAVSASLKRMRG